MTDPLDELRRRRALTQDASRPEKVAARHSRGARTARENLADLLDPGSWVEYGGLASAAQERRLSQEELLASSPADGLLAGIGSVDGNACAVLSYDYLVMAGTQGIRGHHKSDRLLGLVQRLQLPTVVFAEGGGGRPTDTDYPVVSALDVRSFALWAKLSGVVPRIAVVAGRCFAGNAVIAASSDILIATRDATMGVAGPAMVAGAGLGQYRPEQLGPSDVMTGNGVIDVLVDDEAQAVAMTKHLLGLFAGPAETITAADQRQLRTALPERERSAYDVRPIITTLADAGSVVFLREAFAPELVTALGRIEGRTVGILANQTLHMAGALTADAGDKAARFVQLCDAFGFPIVSLVDTPGIMAGPEAEATGILRHASRLLVATARMSVPLIGVVLRRGYGLGAQAMLGGSTHEPVMTVAWPTAHMGPMGLEGAVRLAMGKELDAITDPDVRATRIQEATDAYREHVGALNVARVFEIDDVIDPAETRGLIARMLAVTPTSPSG
ncbi:MAG: carbamoyl-phosphate-synthetase, partial [Candidatus Nanopelagicales bacterium]|nr:carbamoyl-phosphate-synthetase [Candidatus Nanopelagicales bacterium]